MKIKALLEEKIQDSLDELGCLESGTEEYKT